MKRFALATAGLAAAAVGTGYASARPDEFSQYTAVASQAALKAWRGVEANPLPVAVALGTFLLTVVYHKLKGKSLRESVEVAATRVTVVTAPAAHIEPENPVVKRAKARATRAQLVADQIGLQNKLKWLPEAITNAEKDAAYTEQAVADAERNLDLKQRNHDAAVAKLADLRREKAAGDAELAEIDVELKKLAGVV
jgi:hypothetical protein